MKNSLLQKLYDGEICPSESICLNAKEDIELNKQIHEEMKYFESILSSKDTERFDRLADLQNDREAAYNYAYFVKGFRLGLGLIIESLANGGVLILDQ